ncbi:hypothetical protein GGR56DRAFT_264814 [Xylariaceae sp. FL0804]|nr:hypothetical protein GGR56DRAFT_264814 [Xylariaceae sp. FL0804]
MDTTFSDDEKRFVLGEIIKVSRIDVPTLVNFVRAHSVEPDWFSMQLPGGRNMKQCVRAVDDMFQARFPPPNLTNFKRKSLSDLAEAPPSKRHNASPLIDPHPAPARLIKPRPPLPNPNGYPSAPGPPVVGSSPALTATGKKRGRPSKADKEAQAQARATYSRPPTEYAPITPAPLAPIVIQPQPPREYASSPGYEIAGAAGKRRKPSGAMESPRQASAAFPLASPASVTGTPRAIPDRVPESLEHAEKAVLLSPRERERGPAPLDVRSPPLAPYMPQQSPSQLPSHLQSRPPAPIQPAPRPSQGYEQYRGPDPIFPDRDRMRSSMPDQLPREPPASPVADRT